MARTTTATTTESPAETTDAPVVDQDTTPAGEPTPLPDPPADADVTVTQSDGEITISEAQNVLTLTVTTERVSVPGPWVERFLLYVEGSALA